MNGRQYSTQELLQMAYNYGVYNKQNGKESEPLLCIVHMSKYFIMDGSYGSEGLFKQVIEWYEAGYDGLTLVPAPVRWQ